ncbi:MAG TPA: transaldolase family protein [Blastocatellia bacterium]|jgi:transaldolase|nr:transaldolase family protein [Blastocatellia bacterium]
MPIFLDTADVNEIKRFHRMGIVRGVTTNPTILLKEGVQGGMRALEARTKEIAELIAPLPLSVEVTTTERAQVIKQAKTFASWAGNIVVKVTIHGPEGELENLEIIHDLETSHDIRVNVTAMMSAQQCFLAALAGATYVSIFGGRVNNMGYNACGEISRLRKLLDQFNLKSQIIVGSTREVLNVIEWLEAGGHIVTVLPSLLEGMLVHPYSKETVQMFLRDAAKAEAQLKEST